MAESNDTSKFPEALHQSNKNICYHGRTNYDDDDVHIPFINENSPGLEIYS